MPAREAASSASSKEERLLKAALESDRYRIFIEKALVAVTKEGARPNVAAISRKAGFSSRSFIGDVIDGRRRLSAASFPKLSKALGLPTRVKNYFHLLVLKEEPELNFEGLKPDQIESRMQELRSKLLAQLSAASVEREASDVMLKGRDLLDCYAALGLPDSGATVEEICKRTDLPRHTVESCLRRFVESKIAGHSDGRYFSSNPVLLFKDLGPNLDAKACYLQSVDELKRKANASFGAKDRAFHQFVFMLESHRMPEFRQRLFEMMQEFMESSESSNGDALGKLILGFYT